MEKKRRLPFVGLSKTAWQNIAIVAMAAFFVIHLVFPLLTNEMCDGIGSDYCVYWTAGRIINEVGYAAVYDVQTLTQYEKEILPEYYDPDGQFHIAAFMYLPIFAVPFQLLSLLDLRLSFIVWNIIVLAAFALYLRFFTKKVAGHPLETRTFLMVLFSLPILINTYYGQVSIWMAIFVGEFIRAMLDDKPFKAGLWLGGLILKPQLLVVLACFILLQRLYKTIAGMAVTGLAAVAASFLLIRLPGFINLKSLLFDAAGGGVSSAPPLMMNWHMLGSYFALFTTDEAGNIAAAVASVITFGVMLFAFRKKLAPNSRGFYIALLGAMAASEVISWHTHIHMFIALYPILLYLLLKEEIGKPTFSFLMLFPALMYLIRQTLWGTFSKLSPLPPYEVLGLIYIIHSGTFLALNLYLLIWSIKQVNPRALVSADA